MNKLKIFITTIRKTDPRLAFYEFASMSLNRLIFNYWKHSIVWSMFIYLTCSFLYIWIFSAFLGVVNSSLYIFCSMLYGYFLNTEMPTSRLSDLKNIYVLGLWVHFDKYLSGNMCLFLPQVTPQENPSLHPPTLNNSF